VANPYFAAREAGTQRALALHSLRLAAVVALVLALAVVAVKAVAPEVLRGLAWPETVITLGALPAALATVYLQGIILGRQRMVWFNLVEVSQVGTSLIALVAVFAVSAPGLDAVLLVVAGGRYVSLSVALWALRHVMATPAPSQPGLLRRMLGHATRVYLVSLLSFALIRLDLLLVNGLLGSHDAGQYSIAAYISEALIVVPSVVATNLLPRIATTLDSDLTAGVFRSVAVVWGLICLGSAPAAALGIPLVFGHRYDPAVTLYLWLAPGVFCMGMLSALMAHYWVRGYPRTLITVWIVGLLVNVVGNVVLLSSAGVTAAPILSTVTYALVLVVHVAVFSREAGGLRALRPDAREALRLVRGAFGR
jgi:O-antigen/teichoic acid export membrane protein